MVVVITIGKISFGIPHTFSLSRNTNDRYFFFLGRSLPFLLAHDHQLDNFPLHDSLGKVLFPWKITNNECNVLTSLFRSSSSSLMLSFSLLATVITSIISLEDAFFQAREVFLLW